MKLSKAQKEQVLAAGKAAGMSEARLARKSECYLLVGRDPEYPNRRVARAIAQVEDSGKVWFAGSIIVERRQRDAISGALALLGVFADNVEDES